MGSPSATPAVAAAVAALRAACQGDVRDDRLTRALYATDASIYEMIPNIVVCPRSAADVAVAIRISQEHGLPVTPRGAGTGLTGGAVNRGVIIDCSRHLRRIGVIDAAARTVEVEPGVVLDELNARLAPLGLHFAPDVATSSRATLGGMIGNNSCGARSLILGRTVDHLRRIDVALSDGSIASWGPDAPAEVGAFAQRCAGALSAVVSDNAEEIASRYPRVTRSSGGYGLDRVHIRNGRINTEAVVCGSEGTLGIVVGARLNLLPLPRCRGLVVVHFATLNDCLQAVPQILTHQPAAIELLDKFILDATRDNPLMSPRRWFLHGDPAAILIVEFFAEVVDELERRQAQLIADLRGRSVGTAYTPAVDPRQQADIWAVRKAGTGLLMSRPGSAQPHDFVDDASIMPDRLAAYIERLNAVLVEEGVPQAGYYGHASVGVLHVRPVLNLKQTGDIVRLRRIADRVSTLVAEFGGTITGEHGDGLVRSEWLERLYGPRLLAAFAQLKQAFDPRGLLNPGKIVQPLPMDTNLRYGADYQTASPLTVLDFSTYGGLAGQAEMCSGIGECRQRLVNTMCPSFMATGDERDTPRARANALRLALSNRSILSGLEDAALKDVFDLCVSCKACKTECPTKVDIAKLKAEWLHARHQRIGVPRRARLIGRMPQLAPLGSRFAPLSNWVLSSRAVRALMEHWYGLDRRVPPPAFARQTFRQWLEQRARRTDAPGGGGGGGTGDAVSPVLAAHPEEAQAKRHRPCHPAGQAPRGPVVYFADTWTNFHTPQVGRATVAVLEALGYEVLVPPTTCCGRPLLSQGLLDDARTLAAQNVAILAPYAEQGVPIVGTEPSCVSALVDEWPQLVRTDAARRVAACAQPIERLILAALRDGGPMPAWRSPSAAASPQPPAAPRGGTGDAVSPVLRPMTRVLFHGHCHQKSLWGTADAVAVLHACIGDGVSEVNSGCCGMAGAFGHEIEHYDVARAIGEERLFPTVRARGDATVAVAGFSCRQHITHHTGAPAVHMIEVLAAALEPTAG